jgi:hypothetical protein
VELDEVVIEIQVKKDACIVEVRTEMKTVGGKMVMMEVRNDNRVIIVVKAITPLKIAGLRMDKMVGQKVATIVAVFHFLLLTHHTIAMLQCHGTTSNKTEQARQSNPGVPSPPQNISNQTPTGN